MTPPFVIGIAGGSASGKSTLAAALIEHLQPEHAVLLSHDAYYRGIPEGMDPLSINYDHPEAIESSLCAEHLRTLRTRAAVQVPVYDFSTHRRTRETIELRPAQYIVVDGILVFHEEFLRSQIDLRVFVDTDHEIRLERRIQRDSVERGRSEESVRTQWQRSVLRMHEQFVEPSKRHAHLIIPGDSICETDARNLANMAHRAARLR